MVNKKKVQERIKKMENYHVNKKRLLTTFRFLPHTLYSLRILADRKNKTQTSLIEELIYLAAKDAKIINNEDTLDSEMIKNLYEKNKIK